MKNLAILVAALFMASLLAACAATGPAAGAKVKCPACGQEFNYAEQN